MTRDFSAAVTAAGQLFPEPWYLDRTRDTLTALGGDLERDLGPDEPVSLALAAMIAKKETYEGLLTVVPGSRFLVTWREGTQSFTESYALNSVPAEATTGTVDGIAGPADLLVLTDRRIVVPSAAVAEHLRILFTTPVAPPVSDAPTEVLPAAPHTPTEPAGQTAVLPPVADTPVQHQPPPPPPGQQTTYSGAQARGGGSGRKVIIIVAAVLVGLVLLAGIGYGIVRFMQIRAVTPPVTTPTAPSSPEEGPSSEPPSEPGSALPQSAEPLPDDEMVIRRQDDSGNWAIETLKQDGSIVTTLASGQVNRGIVLTRDRRTVLFLRVAGDTSTLRAVAADGSEGRGLFSDGTADCPKLSQPAISADNVLAVTCSGSLNLLNLDGSLIRVLDRGRVGDPTFTRDGSQLIYWKATGAGDGGALYRIPIDGSARPTMIASSDDGPFDDPVCSPTDDVVAASRTSGGQQQIVTLSTTEESPEVTVVLPNGTVDTGPSWSPDGTQIAYRYGNGENSGIAVTTADGSSAGDVLAAQPYLSNPVWTAH